MRTQKPIIRPDDGVGALLTPGEVASLFRVSPKTVTAWARSGKLPSLRTVGGHRRFQASAVRRLMEACFSGENDGSESPLEGAGGL